MVLLSQLDTLEKINGNTVQISPSLETTPPFTPGQGGAKMECADIISQAKTIDNKAFLKNYAIDDTATDNLSIKNKLTAFKAALQQADTNKPITNKLGYSDINTFLTNLNNTHIPLIRLVANCLKEDQEIDMREYNSAKETKEESKSRLESILTPEQDISYYEGWFPIVRPMTEFSLFLLFGGALFLILVSIMVFLSMGGVVVQIQIPELLLPQTMEFLNYYIPPGSSYYLYAGLFFGLIATGIAFRFK